MDTTLLTTADVARARGCHPISVIRAAVALGLTRTGRDWIFSAEQAEAIAARVRDESGNPNFVRKPAPKKRAKHREKRGS